MPRLMRDALSPLLEHCRFGRLRDEEVANDDPGCCGWFTYRETTCGLDEYDKRKVSLPANKATARWSAKKMPGQ
jgi:hypothetical protein